MQRKTWITIFIIIALLIFFGARSINNGTTGKVVSGDDKIVDGNNVTITTEPPKTTELIPSTIEAKIINFAFTPNTIEINAGDTIVWENRDTQGHTVTSNDKIEMNSRLLGLGQKYSHTFNRAGFYAYYCEIHPYMTGKVIVN